MTLGRATAVAVIGVQGTIVTVEADIARGLPGVTIVGMGDTAVGQARDRVRSAMVNSGIDWPQTRITVSLAPASIPKRGARFDVPIAAAVMAASGAVPAASVRDTVLVGELGLDGAVRPVSGVLPSLMAAGAQGYRDAIVPVENLAEAALAPGISVRGVTHLKDLAHHLRGHPDALVTSPVETAVPQLPLPDMADVVGQPEARYAMELAAAGGHHLALIGPPGAGKTMLAARLPGLLPPLTDAESLEVSAIHSVAGTLDPARPMVTRAPFVDPHHSASLAAMVGGGSGDVRPGCVSLAHCGVLFLDEAPEFQRPVLDALRQPLESGSIFVLRARQRARFPAAFQMVLAANPCPCAAARDRDCECATAVRRRYLSRLSGPLMDRVDIRISVPPVDLTAMVGGSTTAEPSAPIAERVVQARERARHRWSEFGHTTNAHASGRQVREYWSRFPGAIDTLGDAARRGLLTARGYDRVLRLALTAADLRDSGNPSGEDVACALALRHGQAAA